jgi:hypothetical protein
MGLALATVFLPPVDEKPAAVVFAALLTVAVGTATRLLPGSAYRATSP